MSSEEEKLLLASTSTDIWVAVTICLLGTICWAVNLAAFFNIRQNSSTYSKACRYFLFLEHILRSLICLVYYFETTCIFNKAACLGADGYPLFLEYLNLGITSVVFSFLYSTILAQFFLSMNRFFAIAFEGKYYEKMNSCALLQVAFILTLPFTGVIYTQLTPGNAIFYAPWTYITAGYGAVCEIVLLIYQGIIVVLAFVGLLLDLITFWRIKSKMKKMGGPMINQAHLRLTVMMCLSHGFTAIGIGHTIFFYLVGNSWLRSISNTVPLFLIKTLVPLIFMIANGLTTLLVLGQSTKRGSKFVTSSMVIVKEHEISVKRQ